MKDNKQWANIGKGARRLGLPVEAVLTKSEGINQLIRAGYAKAAAKEGK